MKGLEDENPQANPDEEPTDAIRDLKERSDEVSDLERSMSSAQWDMEEVKGNLTRVTASLVKMTDGNEARDRKLDDFIKNLSTGQTERDRKTDERIERMERHIEAKMDEKLADFDTKDQYKDQYN